MSVIGNSESGRLAGYPANGRLSLAQATALSVDELLALFAGLDAPGPDELAGEYESRLPDETDGAVRRFFGEVGRGHWLGKAYGPATASGGFREGHNIWERDGRIIRDVRFAWRIGPSSIDGRPALMMRYAAFDNSSGANDLIDEVRRIEPGLYLGVYHTREAVPPFTRRQQGERSSREVFLLGARTDDWRGPDDPAAELLSSG